MIKIYVANLGAYNRGYLVGKWLDLPMDQEDLQEELNDILNGEEAIKSRSYPEEIDEEVAIHDYECDFMEISEYSSISRLNDLAEKLEDLQEYECNTLKALIEWQPGESIEDLIDSVDDYRLNTNINSYTDLGNYWLYESGCYEIPDFLQNYIDEEAFGRDADTNNPDGFFSSYGYIEKC